MRDPNRIDEFCNRLKQAWHTVPDMRFGQIIECAKCDFHMNDIFYVEDAPMIREIENVIYANAKEEIV